MLKKIFGELFSSDAAQPESPTHTASASLSADALHDLECRKRAIVADITRLAQELAACPDLGAPVSGLANPAVAATSRDAERDFGRPSPALSPTWAEASRAYNDGLDRAAPTGIGTLAGAPALARADLAAKLHEAGLTAERAAEARGKGQM